jgi:hypothetical protein
VTLGKRDSKTYNNIASFSIPMGFFSGFWRRELQAPGHHSLLARDNESFFKEWCQESEESEPVK